MVLFNGMFIDRSGDMSFSMKRHLGDTKSFPERGLKQNFIFNCLTSDNSNSPSCSLCFLTKIPLLFQSYM